MLKLKSHIPTLKTKLEALEFHYFLSQKKEKKIFANHFFLVKIKFLFSSKCCVN